MKYYYYIDKCLNRRIEYLSLQQHSTGKGAVSCIGRHACSSRSRRFWQVGQAGQGRLGQAGSPPGRQGINQQLQCVFPPPPPTPSLFLPVPRHGVGEGQQGWNSSCLGWQAQACWGSRLGTPCSQAAGPVAGRQPRWGHRFLQPPPKAAGRSFHLHLAGLVSFLPVK